MQYGMTRKLQLIDSLFRHTRLKAYSLLMGFLCLNISFLNGQDQRVADSLSIIYQENRLEGVEKLELLRELSFNELNDIERSLVYIEEMIALSKSLNNQEFLYSGYLQKGFKHKALGDLQMALTAFFMSAKIAVEEGNSGDEGASNMAIADAYSIMGNSSNAERYYNKAIEQIRKTNDSILLGSALLNAGDGYFNNGNYKAALENFHESGLIFKNVKYLIGTAYNKGNIGMVYAEQGKDDLAEQNINEAITILEEIKDYYPISVYLTYMSDIYLRKNDYNTAYNYALRSLDLAKKYRLKEQISEANLKLFELNQQKGNFEQSIDYLKNYYIYRDSVLNIKAIEQMADLRTNYEVSQKQSEVDLLDQQKRNQQLISLATGIGLLLIIVVAIGLYRRNKFVNRAKLLIENEKERSDLLLLNILPEQTAEELKDNGKVQAKRFDSVSVMFTDFKGFTAYSDKLSPEELVDSIDFYYSKFDDIIEKHGLEKIKTVGDAYMCAGGLPFPTNDHALKMVAAAFEIAEFVNESKKSDPDDMTRFDIRIGINTGPVVAGVVGNKKFAYDIWGDTVNIASRMESNSEPGKINISDNTYQLIKDQYKCTFRGEIDAKNKGMMKMYFVEETVN
jgi:adenylate cyclase